MSALLHPVFDVRACRAFVDRPGMTRALGGTFARPDAATCATTMNAAGIVSTVAANVERSADWFWDQGRRLGGMTLLERAGTNDVLQNRDLTDAAWTATNVTVARSTGIDGVASSGSRLTATAGNGTVIVTTALVHASAARAASLCIKRVTGTGNIQVTLDNGSTWTTVTVTSTYAWVPNAVLQTLANSQFGIRIVTNGDAVDVDYTQNEAGTASTSPIATAGSSVTRAADALDFGFLPTAAQLTGTGVSIYEDYILTEKDIITGMMGVGRGYIGLDFNGGIEIYRNGTSGFSANVKNGSNTSSCAINPTVAVGDRIERLTTVTPGGAITLAVSVNGGTATVGTTGAAGGWPASFNAAKIYFDDESTAARKGGVSRRPVLVLPGAVGGQPGLDRMRRLALSGQMGDGSLLLGGWFQ